MVEPQAAKRPQVRGTVVLTTLIAFYFLLSGYILLSVPPALLSDPELASTRIQAYIRLGVGVLLMIDAVLSATYPRIGLYIGLAGFVLLIILYALLMLTSRTYDLLGVLVIVFMAAAAYYLYKYLTHSPERQFFT